MKTFALNASKKTKSTPAGEIPVDWGYARLEEVAAIQTGLSKSAQRQGETVSMAYLRVANVQDGHFDLSEVKKIAVPVDAVERFRVRTGDVLLTEGGDFDKLGRGAIWNGQIRDCVHQNHIFVVRPKSGVLDAKFLAYQTQGPRGRAYFRSCSKQSTNLASINSTQLKQFPAALPTLSEQHKIAAILSTWDEALEKHDTLIEAKERRRKGLMQQLLTGRSRFPEFGKNPWQKVRMNTLLTRAFRPIEWTADKPLSLVSVRRRCGGLFRRADVLGSGYKTQDLHDLKADDFLISKRQVVHGAWALVTPEFEGAHVSKEYAILTNTAPHQLHMPFFGWLAQTPRLIRLARVASTGVHIEKLIFDPEVFLREIIRLPPTLAEQQQIAETLDACAAEVRLLRQQRTALDRQKRGLMQRLLTGKIRVRTP